MIILTHEIGHMLSHRLFGNDINPIMKKFLTEVESYYMELLCGSYLGITLQEPILEASYREDRLRKTINEAWNIHAQYLMFCHYINSSSKVLGNILNEEGYPLEVTDDSMKRFKKMSLLNNARRVNSYFIALELFKLTQQDPEKGINTYKKLFKSNIDNYNKLLKKFKMNYIEDTSSFDQMVDEAKTLKRVLLKDNN